MEQSRNFNEHPHPCVGVMYPAFLDDVAPAEGRDLPPDGLSLEEEDCFGVIYPAILDEIEPQDDGEVMVINKPFDMSKVICTT